MRNSTTYQIELLFIRHGKTLGNVEKRYIGRTDESLSTEGIAELTSKKYPAADLYFTSPMRRCVETVRLIYGIEEKDLYIVHGYREIDFGMFEGKNYQELSGNPQYQAWIDSGGTMTFPEGESRENFCHRSLEGFREMIALTTEYADRRKTQVGENDVRIAAVVHGGTIMAVLSGLFGGDYYDYQIANGEAYRVNVEVTAGDFRITAVERVSL